MGLDGFVWFIGVVENRNDPAKLGRVQVRCLGFHTEDLTDIPSADLPWAHVMMPVTDPSMQGLGNTPSFLVEGSWVVGFFRDANEKQQPVILGSLPGNPLNEPDITKGFNDLSGNYPSEYRFESGHGLDESDVSRLARDEDAETHLSLINRRATQFKDIPTATKPNVSTVSTASVAETVGTFDEPTPRGTEPTGEYPFNHVHESESGHIKEIDDTPDGERLYTQHAAGTYEEIIADGTKTVKVVGDNYELVAGKSNIYVRGDINLTCSGTKRELIEGDYILEVGGNFTRKVGKSEQVKIGAGESGGNLEEEIKGNHAFNIANSVIGAVGTTEKGTAKDFDITIGGKETRSIGGSVDITATDNYQITSLKSVGILAKENLTTFSVASTSIAAGTSLDMKSTAKMTIKAEDEVDVDGTTINLN
tara:strand:+ start:1125 stop:2387 length:1263 start_codon:yes stop_codon:yes gene_type:complete